MTTDIILVNRAADALDSLKQSLKATVEAIATYPLDELAEIDQILTAIESDIPNIRHQIRELERISA